MQITQSTRYALLIPIAILLWVSCGVTGDPGGMATTGAGGDMTEAGYRACDEMCAADKLQCFPGSYCIDDCYENVWNARGECVDELIPWIECVKRLLEEGQAPCENLWCAERTAYKMCLSENGGCVDARSGIYQNTEGYKECKSGKSCDQVWYFMYCFSPTNAPIACNCYIEDQYLGTCEPKDVVDLYDEACATYLQDSCCNEFFNL